MAGSQTLQKKVIITKKDMDLQLIRIKKEPFKGSFFLLGIDTIKYALLNDGVDQ